MEQSGTIVAESPGSRNAITPHPCFSVSQPWLPLGRFYLGAGSLCVVALVTACPSLERGIHGKGCGLSLWVQLGSSTPWLQMCFSLNSMVLLKQGNVSTRHKGHANIDCYYMRPPPPPPKRALLGAPRVWPQSPEIRISTQDSRRRWWGEDSLKRREDKGVAGAMIVCPTEALACVKVLKQENNSTRRADWKKRFRLRNVERWSCPWGTGVTNTPYSVPLYGIHDKISWEDAGHRGRRVRFKHFVFTPAVSLH